MSAYLICDIDVFNATEYAGYGKGAGALIAKHGGTFIVRGGDFEVLEGDWSCLGFLTAVQSRFS
jgi:uncharacterized protein (DUF1330 family)